MGKILDTTPEKLGYLLESIHNREIALPDFQRDFVWDARATEELVESICQNFPAGSLLRIRNSKDFYFAPREFAGAPVLNGHKPSYLILDGQQRLTSLYQALYGEGQYRFFMDMQGLLDDKDIEDGVFVLSRRDAEKEFGTIAQQAAALVFPLRLIFGSAGGFEDWLDEVLDLRPEAADAKRGMKSRLRDASRKSLEPLKQYEFPMVTLVDSTSADAVCTIFETLNRTGVKLSVFDLLTARFWPQSVKLRDLWGAALAAHQEFSAFRVDPYYVLQAIALFAAEGAPRCRRSDVLKLKVGQINIAWQPCVDGLGAALDILSQDCGVVVPDWLPHNTLLIPAAAALAAEQTVKGPAAGAIRSKFRRWFWCSVFGQAYENHPNSQAAKDFTELRTWFAGGPEPETVRKYKFAPENLREVTPKQRAVYRGVMALILRNGSRDFHLLAPMTGSMIRDESIDDHHIFPKAHLAAASTQVPAELRDCVLNRALIDQKTNVRIGGRAPSDYLAEICVEVGEASLQQVLQSHMLPAGQEGALRQDRFAEFLAERQAALWAKMQEVTSA